MSTRLSPGLEAVPTLSVEVLRAHPGALVIDLRAPAEHAEDHLPGAISLPLFDDAERALIGTLYRSSSPAAAYGAGLRAARERIRAPSGEVRRPGRWPPPSSTAPSTWPHGQGARSAACSMRRSATCRS